MPRSVVLRGQRLAKSHCSKTPDFCHRNRNIAECSKSSKTQRLRDFGFHANFEFPGLEILPKSGTIKGFRLSLHNRLVGPLAVCRRKSVFNWLNNALQQAR